MTILVRPAGPGRERWAGGVEGRPAVKRTVRHFLIGCSESKIEEINAEGEEGAPAKSAVEVRVHVLYRGRWCGIGTHSLMI